MYLFHKGKNRTLGVWLKLIVTCSYCWDEALHTLTGCYFKPRPSHTVCNSFFLSSIYCRHTWKKNSRIIYTCILYSIYFPSFFFLFFFFFFSFTINFNQTFDILSKKVTCTGPISSLLQVVIVYNHLPFFQNIFKFCTFLLKFSNIVPFFNISLLFFEKLHPCCYFLE